MRNLAKLNKDEHILGLTNVVFEKDRLCSACQAGKQVGAHHPTKNILSSSRPLKILHMDLFGPIAYISISGNKYGLVIVDDFSRFTWVFFLQDKSEAKEIVKFIRRVQNEFELKVKNIRSDNGSEFRNTKVEEFLDEEGIKHELSAPYTPQQNGIMERKNRTLIEAARTMLDEYKTLDSFWEEAINTACHAANRLYLHKYLNKTPYEIITGNKPSVHYFRVFGCKCFILNKKPKASKFSSKVDEGFLLGYGTNEHAYRVFNKTTSCVETTVEVKFDESNGSQREKVSENLVDDEEPPSVSIFRMGTGEVMPREGQAQVPVDTSNQDPPSSTRVEPPSSQVSQEESQVHGDDHGRGFDQGGEQSGDAKEEAPQVEDDDDGPIQCQFQAPQSRVHQMVQRDHPVDNILGSIQRGVTTRSRLTNFCAFYSFVSSLEPLSVEQALGDPNWIIAMEEELNNFNKNEVWELVPRPKQNVIGTKWVFRNKQDEFGVVTKNKARPVGKGYTQLEGLDFGETYAPVARLESIRIILAYATHRDFKLHQMDAKSAFLNGPLQEEVYVEKPPGFEDSNLPNHVYKLHKALYGLEQAPRA
jgi:transposase InsO family protein